MDVIPPSPSGPRVPGRQAVPASLAWKIVLPVVLVWLLTALILYSAFSWQLSQQAYADLADRLSSFTAGKAAELTEPVWSFQPDIVSRLMNSYRDNEDLLRIALYDAKGELLTGVAGQQVGEFGQTLRSERELVHHVGKEAYRVGRLEVEFHDGRVLRAREVRRIPDLMLLALFLAVLALAVGVAIQRQVGRPLRRLKESLDSNARRGSRDPLVWRSRDELGQVVQAYNGLLAEVERQAAAMAEVNAALSAEVEQRRKAEERLKLAAKVFEVSVEGISITDNLGNIQQVNAGFERITGYSAAEVVGRNQRMLKSGQLPSALFAEMWSRILGAGHWSGELWNRRKDGESYLEQLTVSCVRGEDGQITHFISVFHDITARKQAEEELRRAQAELEAQVAVRTRELLLANERLLDLDRQRTAFLSSASHELRTPLTSVLGFAKLLRRDIRRHVGPMLRERPNLDAKVQVMLENLEIIGQEGERLTRLINDLLDLNKIEAGRMEWRDEDLDVRREALRAVGAMDGTLNGNARVRLDLDIPENLPPLRADRDRFQQVLINLLSNAAKFTAEGTITLRAEARGEVLRLSVADSGPGIPAGDLEAIFQKFHQGRGGDPDGAKPRGAGLGLAICRHIVEHYGGRIWAESPGRGSTFIFDLPASAPA